jgi:hypothetical protein
MLSTWELSSVHIGFLRLLCMHFHAYMGNISKQTIGLFFLSSILNLLWNRNIFWFVALLCLFAFIYWTRFPDPLLFESLKCGVQFNWTIWHFLPIITFPFVCPFSDESESLRLFRLTRWISRIYTSGLHVQAHRPNHSIFFRLFLLLYINRGTMYRG